MKNRYFLFNPDDAGGGGPPPPAPPPAPDPDAPPTTWEGIFQHSRFKELNQRAKAAEESLAKIEMERKAAAEKAAKEQGKWQELAEQRETELKAERLSRLRLEVASEKGIPTSLADRLTGSTLEELTKDADVLLEFLKPRSGPGVPPAGKGTPTQPLDFSKMTPQQIRDAAKGKSINQVVNS